MKQRRRFERQYESDERVAWVRSLPCLVCLGTPSENAHAAKSKGAGGRSWHIVPLCYKHHDEQHSGVKTFETKYGLNLEAAAIHTQDIWMLEKIARNGSHEDDLIDRGADTKQGDANTDAKRHASPKA